MFDISHFCCFLDVHRYTNLLNIYKYLSRMRRLCRREFIILLAITLSCISVVAVGEVGGNKDTAKSNKENQKNAKLPPCAACRVLTDSFKKVSFKNVNIFSHVLHCLQLNITVGGIL